MWLVRLDKKAKKDLERLDRVAQIRIIEFLGVCCSKLDFEKIILISDNYHDANAYNSHEI